MFEYTEVYLYGIGYHATTKKTSQVYIFSWRNVCDLILDEKSKLPGNR